MGNFSVSACVILGIPNWTDRQINEKKEHTRPLTEDVIGVSLFRSNSTSDSERRDMWWITSIQRPESYLVI